MEARFEDHALFQRGGLRAAAGAAAGAALAGLGGATAAQVASRGSAVLLPLAAAGCAAALFGRGRAALLCSVGAISAAVAAVFRPDSAALPASGALLALGFAAARLAEARESGARVPRLLHAALAAALGALVLFAAGSLLQPLAGTLALLLPGVLALAVTGAALGLRVAAATAPLHLSLALDPVEARLAALRPALGVELRPLAERAAAARRAALAVLIDQVPTGGSRSDLRALLESLTLAALELARRAAQLTNAAAPAQEEELRRRAAELTARAQAASDEVARKSWLRAAETLEGQLAHCRSVRRARERLVARLHEELAQLERTRFSLVLLRGADELRSTVELDLLGARLQHGALACEAEAAAAQLAGTEPAATEATGTEPAGSEPARAEPAPKAGHPALARSGQALL